MNRALRLLLLVPLIVLVAAAADVSGTWKGAFEFNGASVPLTFHLKANGDALTGTVEGLPSTPQEIHEGKLAGDKVTFWINTEYEGQTYKLVYEGKLSGDEIQFTFGTEDSSFSAELTAKKAS